MKVTVCATVIRRTEYLVTREIERGEFDLLKQRLESQDRKVRRDAEKEINRWVKLEDWSDDDLEDVDSFEITTPEGATKE